LFEDLEGFSRSELEKMEKLIPGFDQIVKKMRDNTLTEDDIKNFKLGPVTEDTSKFVRRRSKTMSMKEF